MKTPCLPGMFTEPPAPELPRLITGSDYVPTLDGARLAYQHERIRDVMLDGRWRTLSEIAAATGDHEASISAQLRHLRKPAFGAFAVSKRRRGEPTQGWWEYQVTKEPEL